jgi:hypothetical protein
MGRKENVMKDISIRIKTLLVVVVVFTLLVSAAEAAIIDVIGNGQISNISGISLDNGDFESDLISGFDEKQCVPLLAGTVSVDYLISAADIGQTFPGVSLPQPSSPTIPDGTFSSHILHFDPIGTNGGEVTDATFEFDAPIVAIIANTTFLNDSDDDFGSANAYNQDLDRRFEAPPGANADFFTIASATSLTIDSARVSGSYMDELRVITKCTLPVEIDIKPGSFPNGINPKSKGKIPVAILTTDTFDSTTVDESTVLFGATGAEAAPVQSALEDVDGDGDIDMILHFETQDTGIMCGDTSAFLTGETFDGQMIEGSDSIKTVGCK